MNKISCFLIAAAVLPTNVAYGTYSDKIFQSEIREGLDIVGAKRNADVVPDAAPGALGGEVYEYIGAVDTNTRIFIPTTMYVRMGGGLNLGFATDQAQFFGKKYDASGGYTSQIGLGWNLSSFVRTEIDFQESTLKFSDLKNHDATYHTINGMLYFDFARRYVHTGDVTRRRTFVPFMGLGAGVGYYEFAGANGADGAVIAAPRAEIGLNVMFNDLVGIDIAYQYQMMIGNGFGWDAARGGVDNISNIMASLRVNF